MSCYRLSRLANADLEEIVDFIAAENPEAAVHVLEKLHETFALLAREPGVGLLRDDLHRNLRIFTPSRPAHNYVVFYYPIPDGIEVADVIHARRDWIGMFTRGER